MTVTTMAAAATVEVMTAPGWTIRWSQWWAHDSHCQTLSPPTSQLPPPFFFFTSVHLSLLPSPSSSSQQFISAQSCLALLAAVHPTRLVSLPPSASLSQKPTLSFSPPQQIPPRLPLPNHFTHSHNPCATSVLFFTLTNIQITS